MWTDPAEPPAEDDVPLVSDDDPDEYDPDPEPDEPDDDDDDEDDDEPLPEPEPEPADAVPGLFAFRALLRCFPEEGDRFGVNNWPEGGSRRLALPLPCPDPGRTGSARRFATRTVASTLNFLTPTFG